VPNGRGTIVLAVDGDHLHKLDTIVAPYVAKKQSVVVLVGDRFNAEPYRPGAELKVDPGHITAPPAWAWISENLPFAKDCIFVP
jgi:hypothetical protein